MNNLLKQLLLGGSATALLAGGAMAQNAQELDVETVSQWEIEEYAAHL